MLYRWLADAVVVLHVGFLLFVVLGGLLVLRWPAVAWIHVPCAAWGVLIECAGFVCPLTPLENAWRAHGGELGYTGGFIEHYVVPALYPSGLTRGIQVGLGLVVLAVNGVVYRRVLRRFAAGRSAAHR